MSATTASPQPAVVGFGVVALLIVALTRGRLGYQREEASDSAQTASA